MSVVLHDAVFEAKLSLYFGMSPGIAFSLHSFVGMPVYTSTAHAVMAP